MPGPGATPVRADRSPFDTAHPRHSYEASELLNARRLAMSPQAFTLTGFELVSGVEYAKSWLVSDG